jgi:hypothetical protein
MQEAMVLQYALEQLYRKDRGHILAILRRAYPMACGGWAEDALQACFSAAMARPDAFAESLSRDGTNGLRNLVILAARRMLRQGLRKKDSGNLEWTDDQTKAAGDTPESVLMAHQTVGRIERVIADAARRHGRGKRDAVRAALAWRLTHGRRDLEAAQRFGVPRKYLHLARRFVEQQILPG